MVFFGLLLMLTMSPTSAAAEPYTQLQILLPGESEAPGTISGKTGIPQSQTVGVPFSFRVRAVDDQFYLVDTITDVIQFGSSDASAILPPNTSLVGGEATENFVQCEHPNVLTKNIPVKRIKVGRKTIAVATVFDLFCANYGLDRGLGGEWVATDYAEDIPYTPAWAEKITGVSADKIEMVAREFALNAEKTKGKSMIILGAGLNHWYHMDMNYRGIINMLVMCGCVGQSGGGWSHYVGQEKLRPQTGWQPLAFGLDWSRPPRHMNSTSACYAHTDQWRYEQ